MKIRIVRNESANCITFRGTSVPAYFNSCLSGEVSSENPDFVNVKNDIRSQDQESTFYEFSNIHYSDFEDRYGNGFNSAQEAADYITSQGNVLGLNEVGKDLTGITVNFRLDQTNTSIIMDNGNSFGVNTIKAVSVGGAIQIKSIGEGVPTGSEDPIDRIHFENLSHTLVKINGSFVNGGINDVVDYLNELFTVGAFESVVIRDPDSTTIADVDGVTDAGNIVGSNAIDPLGDDILGTTATHNNAAGYLSDGVINQAGEYFTFDIAGKATYGFGLVHTQNSYDNGKFSGNSTYADPSGFCVGANNSNLGYQFSHHFHIGNAHASWTNYGANTAYNMGEAWYNHSTEFDKKEEWNNGQPVKVKVGINNLGFITISTISDEAGKWKLHARSSYPVPEGSSFRLGIKLQTTGARLRTQPKIHLLEDAAPLMYFRFIESPDGNYEYPLFATEEEANYYDQNHSGTTGTGTSHTHTYVDDPTGTTWYMPNTGRIMNGTTPPQDIQHTVFMGNNVNFTEITSLTDSDLTPPQFSYLDITQQEGSSINIQVQPADVGYISSVTGLPSGLSFVNGYLIQGTLPEVSSDETHVITVTRTNSYGSSIGTFNINITNTNPVSTYLTPWTKALDFSGSSERAQQVNNFALIVPMRMGNYSSLVSLPSNLGYTSSNAHPWMTTVTFNPDGNNSNQHIWNIGEGSSANDDNIYLRLSADRTLYFGWGRGSNNNECKLNTNLGVNQWHSITVVHRGARFSNPTAQDLSDNFSIYYHKSNSGVYENNLGDISTVSNWNAGSTGHRTDRSIGGNLTIGGRGSNRSFHGKVAAFCTTTLSSNSLVPDSTEIDMFVKDPLQWIEDYKVGNAFRYCGDTTDYHLNFSKTMNESMWSTQVWLMGDGINDSYSNMIRNAVYPYDQNYTKLNMISMVSSDIQNININGLS